MGQLGDLAAAERRRRGLDPATATTTVKIIGGGKSPDELTREAAIKAQQEVIAKQKLKNKARKQAMLEGRAPNPAVSASAPKYPQGQRKPDVLGAFKQAGEGLAQVQALVEKRKEAR